MQLNFKERFGPDVESGIKRFSIRPKGKRPRNPKQNVHLFTGLRTKNCRKLGIAPCISVSEMVFEHRWCRGYCWRLRIKGLGLGDNLSMLAHKDGFASAKDFEDFFINMYKLKPGDTMVMEGIEWAKKGDWIWIQTWDDIPPEGK